MSAPETTKKRGAPKKQVRKVALNLTMTPAISKKAKKMAFQQGMSLSTWVEQMIRTKMEESQA